MFEQDGFKQYKYDLGFPNANFASSRKHMHVENGDAGSEELSKTRVPSVILLISDNLDQQSILGVVRAVEVTHALIILLLYVSIISEPQCACRSYRVSLSRLSTKTSGEENSLGFPNGI